MKKVLVLASLFGLAFTGAASAETAAEFASRLQRHFLSVAQDQRIVSVARVASPSNIMLEFGLTPDGKARNAKVVHSIISQADQQLVLDALNDVPPFQINGYADYDATYRLPIRLELSAPAVSAPAN